MSEFLKMVHIYLSTLTHGDTVLPSVRDMAAEYGLVIIDSQKLYRDYVACDCKYPYVALETIDCEYASKQTLLDMVSEAIVEMELLTKIPLARAYSI